MDPGPGPLELDLVIPFTNTDGLRDYRTPAVSHPRRPWPLLLMLLVLAIAAFACTRVPRLVVVVIPGPLTHDITQWFDGDAVCVGEPVPLYVMRRCLSMTAIRAFILTARTAD